MKATANSKELDGSRPALGRSSAAEQPRPIPFSPTIVSPYSPAEPTALDVQRCLKDLQILFRSQRLYQRNHPRVLESLESAYEQLRSFAFAMNGVALRIERNGIVMPKLSEAPLPDVRGELQSLAGELQRAGIQTLVFGRRFHVGELDTLAQLLKEALVNSEATSKKNNKSWWTAKLLEHGVEGIQINTQTDRKVDTVLASLIAAMVAFGGNSPRENADAPISLPSLEDLSAGLALLARLTPPLEAARGLSPEEAARAIHGALEEASRETVHMLLSAISQSGPREAEKPQPYLLRLSEALILEFVSAEFSAGQISPQEVRGTIFRLADALVTSGSYRGPHSSQHFSTLATAWAEEKHRERFIERFWTELPPREKSAVLRGPEIWCVPVPALRQTLSQLADAGVDAPRREARNVLLNYARRLELQDATARRQVAAGLNELSPIIESLWPNQFPEDLGRGTLSALEKESIPETAALLAAFLETLGRIAVTRGDFTGLETILIGLERTPREPQFAHMHALVQRLIAQDRWMLLIDAALANRALDPALPRLLQRDSERLLDRLTLLLTDPRGFEYLPAMSRLLRSIGVPVLNLLESRLYEARRQRVSAAIKLLAAADPERLLRGLPRALASWEWNLQDLAVSELSRPANSATSQSAAFVFSAILADAHPLVVPMMIDQIGLAMESTAVPQMMEIAAGEHDILREQFVRIKAIEALGRMRAAEATELLRTLAEKREGLTHAEPAGLRAAAQDALAMIENNASSARARAAFESAAHSGGGFVVPRRYARVPLESPLRAQIEQGAAGLARVKTISLGGAYLESPKKLTVGDSIKLEVRAGLRKIHFTAVVRNIGPDGNGVEFVHMKDEDREKLRKLVQRHLNF
ncbi:MAG TPA: PilZ domain-containing protein [Candidatus Acidoferrum sp.]|nr:PilZ domain-containing protein [Candidatus Acidoferrum sp.]